MAEGHNIWKGTGHTLKLNKWTLIAFIWSWDWLTLIYEIMQVCKWIYHNKIVHSVIYLKDILFKKSINENVIFIYYFGRVWWFTECYAHITTDKITVDMVTKRIPQLYLISSFVQFKIYKPVWLNWSIKKQSF